jgi:hypothetical protein
MPPLRGKLEKPKSRPESEKRRSSPSVSTAQGGRHRNSVQDTRAQSCHLITQPCVKDSEGCGIGRMRHWKDAALEGCGIGRMRHWKDAALEARPLRRNYSTVCLVVSDAGSSGGMWHRDERALELRTEQSAVRTGAGVIRTMNHLAMR